MRQESAGEAERLERLWQGEFGDQYVERNIAAGADRGPFWKALLDGRGVRRALEVGCNVGANLRHLGDMVPTGGLWGVDVNESSLEHLRQSLPHVNSGWAAARDLPFRDGWFDLVFTVAVLIHQPEDALPAAMAEMVRCSRRWVLAVEYTATATTPVEYRGQRGAFFKRDYTAIFTELFPQLRLADSGELTKAGGFDDGLGYCLFEIA